MLKELQQGQRLLILRYGKQIVENCIKLHQDIIDEIGYCWFGKLGTIPSKKSIEEMLDEEKPMMVLYARGAAYICSVEVVTYDKPENGYPDYYQTELFDKLMYPSIYFKLTSIQEIEVGDLNKFTVISSGNSAANTLMHSMSSFLFVSYGKSVKVDEKPKKKEQRKTKRELLPENDCVYKKDGKCGLRGFVSYQFECERPSTCMRQKR